MFAGPNGTVVNEYEYDSFGNTTRVVEAITQPYRYTGREWLKGSELYHYRARAFDPASARFLQE